MTSGVSCNSWKIPILWPCFFFFPHVWGIARGEVSLKKELRTQVSACVATSLFLELTSEQTVGFSEMISNFRKVHYKNQEISQTKAYKKDANDIKVLIEVIQPCYQYIRIAIYANILTTPH